MCALNLFEMLEAAKIFIQPWKPTIVNDYKVKVEKLNPKRELILFKISTVIFDIPLLSQSVRNEIAEELKLQPEQLPGDISLKDLNEVLSFIEALNSTDDQYRYLTRRAANYTYKNANKGTFIWFTGYNDPLMISNFLKNNNVSKEDIVDELDSFSEPDIFSLFPSIFDVQPKVLPIVIKKLSEPPMQIALASLLTNGSNVEAGCKFSNLLKAIFPLPSDSIVIAALASYAKAKKIKFNSEYEFGNPKYASDLYSALATATKIDIFDPSIATAAPFELVEKNVNSIEGTQKLIKACIKKPLSILKATPANQFSKYAQDFIAAYSFSMYPETSTEYKLALSILEKADDFYLVFFICQKICELYAKGIKLPNILSKQCNELYELSRLLEWLESPKNVKVDKDPNYFLSILIAAAASEVGKGKNFMDVAMKAINSMYTNKFKEIESMPADFLPVLKTQKYDSILHFLEQFVKGESTYRLGADFAVNHALYVNFERKPLPTKRRWLFFRTYEEPPQVCRPLLVSLVNPPKPENGTSDVKKAAGETCEVNSDEKTKQELKIKPDMFEPPMKPAAKPKAKTEASHKKPVVATRKVSTFNFDLDDDIDSIDLQTKNNAFNLEDESESSSSDIDVDIFLKSSFHVTVNPALCRRNAISGVPPIGKAPGEYSDSEEDS